MLSQATHDSLIEEYDQVYRSLTKGWFCWNITVLQYASVAAVEDSLGGSVVDSPGGESRVQAIREVAQRLRERVGWFGGIPSMMLHVSAVLLVRQGVSADEFISELDEFKSNLGVRRWANPSDDWLTFMILRYGGGGVVHRGGIPQSSWGRFLSIKDEMARPGTKEWSPENGILSLCEGAPGDVVSASLDLYQRLLHGGFRPSNPLRTASQLLLLAGTRKCQALANFFQLAENFHHRKLSIRSSHWVELAGLALCPERMSNVVDRVIELQSGLMELKPVVSQKTSVSLACQLALTEYGRDPAANALIPNWKAVIMLLGVSNLLGQRRSF